jgi:gliding motility-associated-like protein
MRIIISLFLIITSFTCFAEGTITGKTLVSPNSIETYTVEWGSSWTGTHEAQAGVNWTVTHGTVMSSDKHTVTIQWEDVPTWLNVNAYLEVSEDLTGLMSNLNVEIFNFRTTESQFCSGVLGPTAIYENFGAGFNPGPPLSTVATNYVYKNNCGLNSGEYTRTNSTFGCRSLWIGLQDHTPNDINGYMLMVDGDNNTSEVYRTTATGLASSLRYEFSVWAANITSYGETTRLKFIIQDLAGNLLQQSDKIEVPYNPSDPWKKISFMFDLPSGSSSVQIILANENNDKDGNDFVVDDISFAPCYSPILASFSNNLNTIVDISEKCNTGTNTLYSRWANQFIPYTNPSFQWEKSSNGSTNWVNIPGATSTSIIQSESSSAIYYYRIKAYETNTPSQFIYSNILTFFVQKLLVNTKNYDFYNCGNTQPQTLFPNYKLENNNIYGIYNNLTFNWSPATYLNNSNISNPIISLPALPPNNNASGPPQAPVIRLYNFTIQNPSFVGCSSSNIQTITQYNPRKVAVPSAFSPNNDGVNDLFRPINIEDYPQAKFWVYNRYGGVIFYSQGPTSAAFSWDGKYNGVDQPIGLYVWKVEIPGCPNNILNASTNNNAPFGTVVLAR